MCPPLRVGIDARMWRHTGIGRYLSNLIPRLAAQPSLDVVAWVAEGDVGEAYAGWRRVTVRGTGVPLFSAREQVYWRLEAPKARLDVFHAPHVNAPLGMPMPMVLTLHDLIPLVFPGTVNRKVGEAYFRGMSRLAPRSAARVIVHATQTRQDLARLRQVPPEKVRVVPLAADSRFGESQSAERRAAVRARFGLSGRYILYTGQWKGYKNLETLIAGFAQVADRLPDTQLVLAGRIDPVAVHVPLAIANHGLSQRVVTTDWIADEDDLVALYQEAAAFVFPSRYEGFGLPPLEAMAAGIPVISSHGGALAEAVGEAALLASPDDPGAWGAAIANLLGDDGLRQRLIQAGLARVKRLSWEQTAEATAAIYKEAFAASGGGEHPAR